MSQQEQIGRSRGQQALSVPSALRVEELLPAWQEQEKVRRRPQNLLSLGVNVLGCIIIARGFSPWLGYDSSFPKVIIGIVMFYLAGLIRQASPAWRLTRRQVEICDQIRTIHDPHAAGPLVDLLYEIDSPHQAGSPGETIVSTLNRLLVGLTEAETVDLLDTYGARLCGLMGWTSILRPTETNDADLIIAILRLLPCRPDLEALYYANEWIMRDTPTHNEQRIREAAREILPDLLGNVDLGGPASLPEWIAKLPIPEWTSPLPEDPVSPLAVMQLLPQLTPAEYLALKQKDRHRIYTSLMTLAAPRLKVDYTLVVLDMVRRSADVEAYTAVESLADGYSAGRYRQVREVAHECLHLLSAQLKKEKLGKTLLRGASAPLETGETLLRSATGNSAADPQLLLRANVENNRP